MVARLCGALACLTVLISGPVLAEQQASGILETARGNFTFAPTACGIYVEDGINDIEVHGPGTGPNGEAVFLEFSSTGSYMTMSFDVTSVFESSEKKFVARDFNEEVSGSSILVDDLILYDQDQEALGPGKLAIDCRPV